MGITTLEGLTYTPIVESDRIGYRVTREQDDRVEYIWLVPSSATDEGPGTGNVFAYYSTPDEDDPEIEGEPFIHVAFFTEADPQRKDDTE